MKRSNELMKSVLTFQYKIKTFNDDGVIVTAQATVNGAKAVLDVQINGVKTLGEFNSHEGLILTLVLAELYKNAGHQSASVQVIC